LPCVIEEDLTETRSSCYAARAAFGHRSSTIGSPEGRWSVPCAPSEAASPPTTNIIGCATWTRAAKHRHLIQIRSRAAPPAIRHLLLPSARWECFGLPGLNFYPPDMSYQLAYASSRKLHKPFSPAVVPGFLDGPHLLQDYVLRSAAAIRNSISAHRSG
jgi:hypothetical protein